MLLLDKFQIFTKDLNFFKIVIMVVEVIRTSED